MAEHQFRYYLAGGASLAAIEAFLEEEINIKPEDFPFGAHKNLTENDMALHGYKPSGVYIDDDPSKPLYIPDITTATGRKLFETIKARQGITHEFNAQRRFAQWCKGTDIDLAPGARRMFANSANVGKVSFEKVGDDIIITVPVVNYKDGFDWIKPEGATAIAVSDYFKRLEDAGMIALEPTSPNRVEFNPRDFDIA